MLAVFDYPQAHEEGRDRVADSPALITAATQRRMRGRAGTPPHLDALARFVRIPLID